MASSKPEVLIGGGVELDIRNESACLNGEPIHLSPTGFKLLSALMVEPQTLVRKEHLMATVWDGRVVSDAALTTAVREVRRALGDPARTPLFIETVHGRGYRFLHAVEAAERTEQPSLVQKAASAATELRQSGPSSWLAFAAVLALAGFIALGATWIAGSRAPQSIAEDVETEPADDVLAIAVLPFTSSGTQSDEVADMMHDDLLTRLSTVHTLQVISRTSMTQYRETMKSPAEIASELNVDAILEGSLQMDQDQLRINVKLVDPTTEAAEWAASFDRMVSGADMFSLQADLSTSIVDALTVAVSGEEAEELIRPGSDNFEAYTAYFRGKRIFEEALVDNWQADSIAAFDEALAIDPNLVVALAAKAHVQLSIYWYGDGTERVWIDRARESLERAEALDPNNVDTLLSWGYYFYWGFRDYETAEVKLAQALELNPNRAEAWELRGYVARRRGDFETAVASLARAYELNPLDIELVTERLETFGPLGRVREGEQMIKLGRQLNSASTDLVNNEALFWLLQGDFEASYAAINRPVMNPAQGHFRRVSDYTLPLANEALLRESFETWPEDFLETPLGALQYNRIWAEFWINADNDDAAAPYLAELGRLSLLPEIGAGKLWTPNGSYHPVDYPGLLRDLDAVEREVIAYEALGIEDTWQVARHWSAIAKAFARAGSAERSLDYVERYVGLYGPASVSRFVGHPAFEAIFDEPRFLALVDNWHASIRAVDG